MSEANAVITHLLVGEEAAVYPWNTGHLAELIIPEEQQVLIYFWMPASELPVIFASLDAEQFVKVHFWHS